MRTWAFGVATLVLGVHCLPAHHRADGIYLTDAVQRGEPLRWVFAHFIHRDWAHLGFNVVSWVLACWVLAPVFHADRTWPWGLGLVAVGISGSVSFLSPGAPPFVGLSALVYAWLVAGAVRGFALRQKKGVYGILLVVLFAKAALEAFIGRDIGGAGWIDTGPAAAQAHAHALGWGIAWGLVWPRPRGREWLGRARGRVGSA